MVYGKWYLYSLAYQTNRLLANNIYLKNNTFFKQKTPALIEQSVLMSFLESQRIKKF